ncbi:sugar ABC transporter permease [Natrarchaeobius chitinivorans]|uniref:Sugar ABC transporter permease n=2 Tax=Natrarchaeobius chitinivorans TaxID=1679083 RepID=A0A3N6MIB3_NATCH|nr:sugar ABC transporter permease [Natrarchaeobius chitinivorans]
MAIVHFLPILWGALISIMQIDAVYVSQWYNAPFIGLENYGQLFDFDTTVGSRFWFSMRQTAIFALGTVLGSYSLGLLTAILLDSEFRGSGVARILVLLPWICPAVVVLLVWRMMLLSDTGIINHVLLSAGVISDPLVWLIGPNAIYSMILVNIWINFPWATIMLYAALKSIPDHLYEAARIDGAGRWGQFRYVTLPQLKPISVVISLLLILWSFINFTVPFVLLGQSATRSGEVSMLFIYNYAFQNYAFGLGGAMSVVLFLFAMGIALIYYKYAVSGTFEGEGDD